MNQELKALNNKEIKTCILEADELINQCYFALTKIKFLNSNDPLDDNHERLMNTEVKDIIDNAMIYNHIISDYNIEAFEAIKKIRSLLDKYWSNLTHG